MPHTLTSTFVPPEQRITREMRTRLEALAELFEIIVIHKPTGEVQLSGRGFSGTDPLVLNVQDAPVRLLAEICSILTRWIPFSVWEPCEVTLFALSTERVVRCATSFRKQLAAQERIIKRENEARNARELLALSRQI